MPKRPPTPPINTNNVLVAIWNPWPAGLAIDDKRGIAEPDCEKLVCWLSCMVNSEDLLCIYWKPKSKMNLLVELSNYPKYERALLGSHKWIDAFQKVDKECKGNESKIYPCALTYSAAEKLGWKAQSVKEDWFQGWKVAKNKIVMSPYPKPDYCELPDNVDITEICRRIPESLFPEIEMRRQAEKKIKVSEAIKRATPGTSAWQNAKANEKSTSTQRGQGQQAVKALRAQAQKPQRSSRPIKKTTGDIDVEITEQAMFALLGPAGPPTRTPSPELPTSMEPITFNWFDDVEETSGPVQPAPRAANWAGEDAAPAEVDPELVGLWGATASWEDQVVEPEPPAAPPTPPTPLPKPAETKPAKSPKTAKKAATKQPVIAKATQATSTPSPQTAKKPAAWQKVPLAVPEPPAKAQVVPPAKPVEIEELDPDATAELSDDDDPMASWAAEATWDAPPTWDFSNEATPKAPVAEASKAAAGNRGGRGRGPFGGRGGADRGQGRGRGRGRGAAKAK